MASEKGIASGLAASTYKPKSKHIQVNKGETKTKNIKNFNSFVKILVFKCNFSIIWLQATT